MTPLNAYAAAMFTFGIIGSGSHFDPLVWLQWAWVWDAAVGGMGPLFRFAPHPGEVIGRLIGWLDKKLNRPNRSSMDRAVRGSTGPSP